MRIKYIFYFNIYIYIYILFNWLFFYFLTHLHKNWFTNHDKFLYKNYAFNKKNTLIKIKINK